MFKGVIKKLITYPDIPIKYFAEINDEYINVNQLIGKNITIKNIGYECLNCKKNKKIFSSGFCYDCFSTSAKTGEYILHPEKSTAHLNIEDRDLEYEKQVQLQPHLVYLANTGQVKVGVTRETQMPTRWIDQGAEYSLIIARTENRYLAGIIEVELKKYLSDKTNWRKMLEKNADFIDLIEIKNQINNKIPNELLSYFIDNQEIYKFNYPIENYPTKINSSSFTKTKQIEGKLVGIKGQYLLFDQFVFNWRTHEGHLIELEIIN
jgi:hypothetical protein